MSLLLLSSPIRDRKKVVEMVERLTEGDQIDMILRSMQPKFP